MIAEAAAELEAVPRRDRFAPAVMAARVEVHTAAGQWDVVATFARRVLKMDAENVAAWISLGCAVRRTEGVDAARQLLLTLVPRFGSKHAIIHYNLACYTCLVGEIETAKDCLAVACKMDAGFKAAALSDPDLQALRDQLGSIS